MTYLINYKGVCKTALATLGLLTSDKLDPNTVLPKLRNIRGSYGSVSDSTIFSLTNQYRLITTAQPFKT